MTAKVSSLVAPGRNNPSIMRARTTVLQRRAKVAELFLNRFPEHEMARVLGVSRTTISSDIHALQIQWYNEATISIDEHKSRIIAELDAIIGECTTRLHSKNRDKDMDAVWVAQWRSTLLEKAKVIGLTQQRLDLPNDGRTITVREVVIEVPNETKQLGPVIDA